MSTHPDNDPKAAGEEKDTRTGAVPPDDPSRYENHDESRENAFDPRVAKGIGMDLQQQKKNEEAGEQPER